jgi:hypothetical protein
VPGFEKRNANRRQKPDRRLQPDAGSLDTTGPADTNPTPKLSRLCPKCGSAKLSVTAEVNEEAHQLSLVRCEVCSFRFTHLTSAES